MKNFLRRVKLIARGIMMFKDWDVWLAERFNIRWKTGVGIFRLRSGINFTIDYSTSYVWTISEIWLLDYYERWHKIQQGEVVIDIGAHIGTFSVLAASKGAKVYAYEPTPASCEFLKKNTEGYDVYVCQLAVSDVPGDVTLFASGGHGSSGNSILPVSFAKSQSTARATTLPMIFTDNQIDRCDLLKMDCEGAEVNILKDVPRDVFRKIKNIAMEYHGNLPEIKKILESKGYRILEAWDSDLGYLWASYNEQ